MRDATLDRRIGDVPAPLRRPPLVDLAITELRRRIERGVWLVGERLPATPILADQLGVGRSTVREAVRALVHAGLLEARQGAGTFVVSTSERDALEPRLRQAALLHVYEIRTGLEVQGARLAAERRTDQNLERIEAAWHARQDALDAGRDVAFVASDVLFHAAVMEATHNPLLVEVFTSFQRALKGGLEQIVGDTHFAGVDNTEAHAELLEAIRKGDGDAAAIAAERLIDDTAGVIRSMLGSLEN